MLEDGSDGFEFGLHAFFFAGDQVKARIPGAQIVQDLVSHNQVVVVVCGNEKARPALNRAGLWVCAES
jgi:hypothetical protein